jgi:nucleoside 2-deoxyribosyltransferase/DNA-binding ferritin-like protein (Dps family)
MSKHPCAFIIDVPDPQNTCFVAIPMNKEESSAPPYAGITDIIKSAANSQEIRAHRTDEEPGRKISDDIANGISSAKIVVAVIGPNKNGAYNANVMYELGRAHALGKPTVILSCKTDGAKDPFDIHDFYHIDYDSTELADSDKTKCLTKTLSDHIRKLLEKAQEQEGLVDPAASRVHAESLRLCSRPEIRANLKMFFSLSQSLQKFITEPKDYMESLAKTMKNIFDSSEKVTKETSYKLINKWNDYKRCYESIPSELFLSAQEDKVYAKAMQEILGFAEQIHKDKVSVTEDAKDSYDKIKSNLLFYKNSNDNFPELFSKEHKTDLEDLLQNKDRQQEFFDLCGKATNLAFVQGAILKRSNLMVCDLIELID